MKTGDRPADRQTFLVCWLALSLLCLAIHWLAFRAWFRADDFAWMGLTPTVHSFHDLLIALFQPRAQGTIRPFSERAFFMAGYSIFGLNPLPYRLVIFATEFADLALLLCIARRLTGSLAAGVCAALFWVLNSSTFEPLGWTCVYNEVMCAGFLMLAFYFLLRYIETGEGRYNLYQWVVFVLGFGALELNVVYPAIAGAYTLFCARRHFRRVLPMFAVSALYFAVHSLAAPAPHTGDYAVHVDFSMLRTLKILWKWSVGPAYSSAPSWLPAWTLPTAVTLLSLALFLFAGRRWRTGVALFFLAWYLLTIAPMLPLRDHRTEYYPFIPVIGLCWLGGWAFMEAWRSAVALRLAALALALAYAVPQVVHLENASRWNYDLTIRARNLVEGVAGAHQLHPDEAILLYGVDTDLFIHAIRDHPFRLLGIKEVYLAPGTGKSADPAWNGVSEFVLPGDVVTSELRRNDLVVYDVRGPLLHNITSVYASMPRDNSLPSRVDPGDPLSASMLGPEWYKLDGNHRWMPKTATLHMAGPESAGQKLYLRGNCTDEQLKSGPLEIQVTVNALPLPPAKVDATSFEVDFPLPPALVGRPAVTVSIDVSRTFRPPDDDRNLGLAFGAIEIR